MTAPQPHLEPPNFEPSTREPPHGPPSHVEPPRLAARYSLFSDDMLGPQRTPLADARLGLAMTFVAGATNAGGFLAVGQYTSHMSGIISAMADNAVIGAAGLVLAGLGGVLPFVLGAATSAVLVNWARFHHAGQQYALPLTLEAFLLLGFGALGDLAHRSSVALAAAVAVLCFIMGLQNATVTKLSGAKIRTTHMTGVVTDLGIELGKLFYVNRNRRRLAGAPLVYADREKLKLLALFVTMFLGGGLVGALGFKYVGFIFCVPLAILILILAGPSVFKRLLR